MAETLRPRHWGPPIGPVKWSWPHSATLAHAYRSRVVTVDWGTHKTKYGTARSLCGRWIGSDLNGVTAAPVEPEGLDEHDACATCLRKAQALASAP